MIAVIYDIHDFVTSPIPKIFRFFIVGEIAY